MIIKHVRCGSVCFACFNSSTAGFPRTVCVLAGRPRPSDRGDRATSVAPRPLPRLPSRHPQPVLVSDTAALNLFPKDPRV